MPVDQLEPFLDDPVMREALAIVLERSDAGTEELHWVDVRDELSREQWGRLIHEGLLVEAGSGFALANPEHLRGTLADEGRQSETGTSEGDGESWAWYDKVAGVATLVLFAGYWHSGVRDAIASLDNVVLAPLTHLLPFYAVVLVLAAITGLYSTVLQARLMNTERMEAYQEQLADLRERKQAARERGDEEQLERLKGEEREALEDQIGMFKLQFRPMVWIMLLTIPAFLWLRWTVRGGHLGVAETGLVVPLAGPISWQQPLFGPMSTWLVWYFVCSIVARQVIQKTLGIRTSPSS